MSVQTSEHLPEPRFYAYPHTSNNRLYWVVVDRAVNEILAIFNSKENAELFCEAKAESLKKYLT